MKRSEMIYRCRNCKKEFSHLSLPEGQHVEAVRENKYLVDFHLDCKKGHIGIGDLIRVEITERY